MLRGEVACLSIMHSIPVSWVPNLDLPTSTWRHKYATPVPMSLWEPASPTWEIKIGLWTQKQINGCGMSLMQGSGWSVIHASMHRKTYFTLVTSASFSVYQKRGIEGSLCLFFSCLLWIWYGVVLVWLDIPFTLEPHSDHISLKWFDRSSDECEFGKNVVWRDVFVVKFVLSRQNYIHRLVGIQLWTGDLILVAELIQPKGDHSSIDCTCGVLANPTLALSTLPPPQNMKESACLCSARFYIQRVVIKLDECFVFTATTWLLCSSKANAK